MPTLFRVFGISRGDHQFKLASQLKLARGMTFLLFEIFDSWILERD